MKLTHLSQKEMLIDHVLNEARLLVEMVLYDIVDKNGEPTSIRPALRSAVRLTMQLCTHEPDGSQPSLFAEVSSHSTDSDD